MAPKKRRADDASSSRTASRGVHLVPPTRVGEETPEHYNFTVRDRHQRTKFDYLKKRKWSATKSIDWDLVETLGLTRDLMEMSEWLNLHQFMRLAEPTYKGLTLEFLSTLIVSLEGEGDCSFYLGGARRKLNLKQVNDIFGFHNFRNTDAARIESQAWWLDKSFWRKITGKPTYKATKEKASPITNPVIRIFQRFIASTINGRGDGGNNCSKKDLTILCASLEKQELNLGGMLMNNLDHVSNKGGGAICIGGIVTHFARHYNIDLSKLPIDLAPAPMNFQLFHKMGCLFLFKSTHYWTIGSTETVMRLPDPARVRLIIGSDESRSWMIHTRDSDLPLSMVSGPSRGPRRVQQRSSSAAEDVEMDEAEDESDDEFIVEDEESEEEGGSQYSQMIEMMEKMQFDNEQRYNDMRGYVDERFAAFQARQDEQFRLLNSRLDGWSSTGYPPHQYYPQYGFPPPPYPEYPPYPYHQQQHPPSDFPPNPDC